MICVAIVELAAAILAEAQEPPDSLWWKLLKIAAIGAVGIGVGMWVEKVRQTTRAVGAYASDALSSIALTGTNSRLGKKTKPHNDGDDGEDIKAEDMAEKLNQSEQRAKTLEDSLEKSATEISRLANEKQILERQVSDLKAKLGRAGRLEKVAPELIDWIQSVIGYAGNKCLFLADADELAMFRSDAKRLPMLLRNNGIQCDWGPPSEGLGFLHKRDARVADGNEVVSAPMLLREGAIIAEGVVLVPDIDVVDEVDDSQGAKNSQSNESDAASSLSWDFGL